MPQYAYFKGEIVPIEEAKVSIMTHALNYGTGAFEGIRAYWSDKEKQLLVFRMPEHYDRMHKSCSILKIKIPHTTEELCDIPCELLKKEDYTETPISGLWPTKPRKASVSSSTAWKTVSAFSPSPSAGISRRKREPVSRCPPGGGSMTMQPLRERR